MIPVITRFNVLIVLLILTFFGPNLLADQENSTNASQALMDLEDHYSDVEMQLKEQARELDRILGLGYGGTGLGKDLKLMAENVESYQARLNELKQQLDEETHRLDSLKDNTLSINNIWLTDKVKGLEEFKQIPEDSAAYLYVSFIMPMTMEAIKIKFTVTNKKTNEEVVNVEGERLRKGEEAEQKTGIELTTDNLTLGEIYQFTVVLIDIDGKELSQTIQLQYGQLTRITRIWVTDKAKSEEELKQIPEDSAAYLYVSFIMPMTMEAIKINFTVANKKTNEEIVNVEGERPRKGEEEAEQKTGIELTTDNLTLGEIYQFTVVLIDIDGKELSQTMQFQYGQLTRITRMWVTNKPKDETDHPTLAPDQTPVMYVAFDMSNELEKMRTKLVVRERSSGEIVALGENEKVRKTKKLNQRIGMALAAGELKSGGAYRFEATLFLSDGKIVESHKDFEISDGTQEYEQSESITDKKFPRDLKNHIKVSGVIKTPGLPVVIIDDTSNGLNNTYRHNSTFHFTIPAIYPDGFDGELEWRCKHCNAKSKIIPLDGSINDWSFSYSPERHMRGMQIQLYYKGEILYSTRFNWQAPLVISILTGDYQAQWGIGDVGVALTANSHAQTYKVTAKAVQSHTGEVLFNEKKSMSLAADKKTKWLWHIDPKKLRFNIEQYFPNITEAHLKKNILLEVTVDDGKGYKKSRTKMISKDLFFLNDRKYFKDGPGTFDNPLVKTIIPPSGMKGPFKTSLIGISAYYIDGLKWYYDPEKLESWVNDVGAKKFKETEDRVYYRKSVPLLITIEDSTGKQAAAFWNRYTYSVELWRP